MGTLGCRAPDPTKLVQRALGHHHPLIGARLSSGPLPSSADKLPPWFRIDQGGSSGCTACSFVIAVMMALEAAGYPLGWVPSQQEAYSLTHGLERARVIVPGMPVPLLVDNGADLDDVITIGASYGLRPMKVPHSPDGRVCDIWTDSDISGITASPPATVNNEPDLDSAIRSMAGRIAGAYYIDPANPAASDQVAAALDASPAFPIWIAFWVDTTFQRLKAGDVAGAPNFGDRGPGTGGHAVALSKYRTNRGGRREFFLENSWGPLWAAGGGVWVSEAFVSNVWAMWAMSLHKVSNA